MSQYLDQNLMFADKASMVQVIGSLLLPFSVDSRVVGTPILGGPLTHNFGVANPFQISLTVTTTFVGATATIQWQVVQADDGPLTTNLQVLRQTAAIPIANFVAGVTFNLGDVPPMSREFLGLRMVVAVANVTAGNATAGLSLTLPSNASSLLTLAA